MAQKYMDDPVQKFRETKSKVIPTSPGVTTMQGATPKSQAQKDSEAADNRHQHATKLGKTTLTPKVRAGVESKVKNDKQPADPPDPKFTTGPGYDDKSGVRRVG